MIKDILTMNGYGLYVWLSFAVTFFSCIFYYVKTYKELKKYEKEFAKELEKLPAKDKKRVAKSSKVISSILASQNKLS